MKIFLDTLRGSSLLTGLILSLFLCSCGKAPEAALVENLFDGLHSLGSKNPIEAKAIHDSLYDEALEVEKRGRTKHININRTIGYLALRRAMLAEMTNSSERVVSLLAEAKERLAKGDIMPRDIPIAQQNALLRNEVVVTLSGENPPWRAELIKKWEDQHILDKDNPEALRLARLPKEMPPK